MADGFKSHSSITVICGLWSGTAEGRILVMEHATSPFRVVLEHSTTESTYSVPISQSVRFCFEMKARDILREGSLRDSDHPALSLVLSRYSGTCPDFSVSESDTRSSQKRIAT